MLHNGVFTLDERLQHEKLGRKRDFCGAKIFNNLLKVPFCLICTFSSELGRKNNLTFYVNSHIYPKGELTYEREKKMLSEGQCH